MGSATTGLPTAGSLPIDVTPLPLPTPTPTPTPALSTTTVTAPLQTTTTTITGAAGTGGSTATGTATGGTGTSGSSGPPTYQPSQDEQQSLPNEPSRVAYEQQQSDVGYDQQQLDAQESPIAVQAGGGSGRFGWPLVIHGRPPITQRFGCTDVPGEPYNGDCPTKRWHTGIDIGQPTGTPVFAADAGVVHEYRSSSGYGNYILIIHGNGYATLYGHLSDFAVPDGTVVKRGEQVGFVGSTGFSTGPHLHFEIRYQSAYIDPCAELRC